MTVKKKYLIALPCFRGATGFNHKTILVSATDENDAVGAVLHIKGNNVNIGDIKEVNY
jgi:hypothetical protein